MKEVTREKYRSVTVTGLLNVENPAPTTVWWRDAREC